MATLTIKSKSSSTQSGEVVAKSSKAPVRRQNPINRSRTVAPVINKPSNAVDVKKLKTESVERPQRQRNHRHDGSLHEVTNNAPFPDSRASTPHVMTPKVSLPKESTRNVADREGVYRNPPRRGGKVRDGFVASEFDKNHAIKTNKRNDLAKKNEASENNQLPRLSKRMAELGLCSRREADEWIVNGWVKVDGVIIETLGTRINSDAEIIISGYAKEQQAENATFILHKPVGYVSGQAEDGYEPAVVLIHPDNQWEDDQLQHQLNPKQFQRGFLQGLAPAGRLDIDSTGMLVLTQDGRIARHLIGEDSTVEKEYLVRVRGHLTEDGMKKLNFGLSLDGVKLKPAKVSWQNEDQLRFVLREGKKRQIRRMCELVGLEVVGLKRIRIGSVTLGKLPVGQWRYLRMNEKF